MDPSPEQLRKHLINHYPGGKYYSVYEAGFCGFWIHRDLTRLGIENIVVNPADVPTTHKEKRRRRDPVDSSKLARELAHGSLTSIYIPDPFHEDLRALCRLYHKSVSHRTRLKNRIRSFLYSNNVPIPARTEVFPWSGRFVSWLEALEFGSAPAKSYLQYCLNELHGTRTQTKTLLKELRILSQAPPIRKVVHELLRSVPGVGFITSMTFYAEIMDMNRFRSFDQLASFAGLVPDTDSSGERDTDTGLTFRRNRHLRHMLIESAWIAARFDPALTQKYHELLCRMKKQQAIIRIAKKLLSRMRYVWMEETPYVKAVV
jgi:transposase